MNIAIRFVPLLSAAVVLAGCDGNPSGSRASTPAQLVVISGDAQQATVGTELAQPLVVRVVDSKGKPVRDQIVNFRVVSGGGSVYAGSAITDHDGEARERWTLGTLVADSQRVEARAVDSSTGAAQLFGTFRATAVAGPAAAVQVVTGTYAGAIGAPVADSVTARVVDAYGNPVAGAQVAWQVTSGGGSVSPATSTSNAAGIAKTQWTLGTVVGSTQQMVVKLNGSVGGSFVAQPSLSPGAGAVVTLLGDGQTATVATAPAQPVGVKVTLPDGRPVIGLYVHYVNTDLYTDSLGVATLPVVMPERSGAFAPVATVGSLGQVTFHLTAAAGAPTKFLSPPLGGVGPIYSRGIPVGTQYSVVMQVGDKYDNPVPGATVTWQYGGTGSLSPVQSVTDANGQATTVLTAGPYVNGNTANDIAGKVGSVTSSVIAVGYTVHAIVTEMIPASPDTIEVSVGDSVHLGVAVHDETGAPISLGSGMWIWVRSDASVLASSDFDYNTSYGMKAIAPGTARVSVTFVFADRRPVLVPEASKIVVVH